jgi:hypothetical protein
VLYSTHMGLRAYSITMAIGTVLAWIGWGIVLFNMSPQEAGFFGFVLFYLTLGVALVGTLALLGSGIRILLLRRHDVPSREIQIAFRHAILFSATTIVSLLLAAHGWFRMWSIAILVLLVSIAEYVILTGRHGRG